MRRFDRQLTTQWIRSRLPDRTIRLRLTALYGAAASLSLDPEVDRGLRAVIEIPHESIDHRSHR